MRVLVDTSIWVRCSEPDNPLSIICAGELADRRARGQSLLVCAQVLIEFWVVATRPIEVNGLGMTAEATDEAITDILTISAVADEPNDMATRWREMAVRYGPKGKICHDLRIVALASAHGIDEILTLNQGDLGRFAEVRSVGPNMARTTTGSGDVSG